MTSMATCDALFSRLVRLRDGRCQVEDCTVFGVDRLECAHIVSRRFHRTRCDERNAIALCSKHHHWFTEHPDAWEHWVIKRIGSRALTEIDDLAIGRHLPLLAPRPDWKAIAAGLRERLTALEAAL